MNEKDIIANAAQEAFREHVEILPLVTQTGQIYPATMISGLECSTAQATEKVEGDLREKTLIARGREIGRALACRVDHDIAQKFTDFLVAPAAGGDREKSRFAQMVDDDLLDAVWQLELTDYKDREMVGVLHPIQGHHLLTDFYRNKSSESMPTYPRQAHGELRGIDMCNSVACQLTHDKKSRIGAIFAPQAIEVRWGEYPPVPTVSYDGDKIIATMAYTVVVTDPKLGRQITTKSEV